MAAALTPPSIPWTPPHVSVNRVRIVDLPGLPVDEEVRGQLAYHLLSIQALTQYAREQAVALRLPDALAAETAATRRELPRFVNRCLTNPEPTVRAAAHLIAQRLGRNLAYILITLRRGDAINRAARPDWTSQEWERWALIERVWLGGGLLSPPLGEQVVAVARATLAELGLPRPQVALAPHGELLPLLGAARYLPPGARAALCLDGGHSRIKRAVVTLTGGRVTGLHPLPPLALPGGFPHLPAPTERLALGHALQELLVGTIARTLAESQAAGWEVGPDLMLSVAAYVEEGRLLGHGLYATLSVLTDDVRPWLAAALQARTGRPWRVHLIHDGTAASAVYAGEPQTAVTMVGTALGIGFPPATAAGLRPLVLEEFS